MLLGVCPGFLFRVGAPIEANGPVAIVSLCIRLVSVVDGDGNSMQDTSVHVALTAPLIVPAPRGNKGNTHSCPPVARICPPPLVGQVNATTQHRGR